MTFDLDAAVQQAWTARLAHQTPTGPQITVRMHLDGPRDLSITVPADFASWPADQQCAAIDRAKLELLNSSVDLSASYSEDEYWEQPSGYCMPCDPTHLITPTGADSDL